MITSSEKVGNGLAKLTIELSVEELRREYGRAAKRISSRTRIPGFRPGKAPVTVVENMYGKPAIINEAVEKLVPDSYANALRAEDLFAVDQPEIDFVDDEDITFEKPVVFTATVPLRPTVELGDHSSIVLTQDTVEVSDEDVDSTLQQLRQSRAESIPVEGRGLQTDDLASAIIKMLVDDDNQMGDAEIRVAIGGNGFPEGFDEAVLGMMPDDVREFELSFEDGHPDESMRGKVAQFRVELKSISQRDLPELNDEFVALVSELTTVEELKGDISKRLLEERNATARGEVERSALELLAERSTFEIPEVVVHRQAHALMEEQTQRMTSQGVALDTYLGSIGSSPDEFHDQAVQEAGRQIRNTLLLDAFAESRDIRVGEEDVDAELEQLMERFPDQEREQMRDYYLANGGRERMAVSLHERRAMDALMKEILGTAELVETEPEVSMENPTRQGEVDEEEA